jgi:DNA-binding IclR family transcriptional regulator
VEATALASTRGRLVAAHSRASERELKAQIETLRWPRSVEFESWDREVERTRRLGHGVDFGIFGAGVALVAVPYFGAGNELTQTVVCADVKSRMTAMRLQGLVHEIQGETAALDCLL